MKQYGKNIVCMILALLLCVLPACGETTGEMREAVAIPATGSGETNETVPIEALIQEHRVTCYRCDGDGLICVWCEGDGREECYDCSGSGICENCHGAGMCIVCNGRESESCSACNGSARCTKCSGSGECCYCELGYMICNGCQGGKSELQDDACYLCGGSGSVNFTCMDGKIPCDSCVDGKCISCKGEKLSACLFCNSIGDCVLCDGSGEYRGRGCVYCGGSGKCNRCNGAGFDMCNFCVGTGVCYSCGGTSYEDCPVC